MTWIASLKNLDVFNLPSQILTNKKELFKNSNVLEVGISDHHSFVVTALKSK